jgi:hypothetical protein
LEWTKQLPLLIALETLTFVEGLQLGWLCWDVFRITYHVHEHEVDLL